MGAATQAAATEAEAIARNSVTQAKIGIRARVWGDQSRRFKRTVIYRTELIASDNSVLFATCKMLQRLCHTRKPTSLHTARAESIC